MAGYEKIQISCEDTLSVITSWVWGILTLSTLYFNGSESVLEKGFLSDLMSCYTRSKCIQKAGVCLESNFLSFWKLQLEEHISGLRENAAVLRGLACCLPFRFLTNEKLYCFLHGRSTSTKPWPSGVRFVHLTLQKKSFSFYSYFSFRGTPPPKWVF